MSITYLYHIDNKIIDNQLFIQLIFFDHKSQTMIFCVLFQDIPLPLQPQWNISWTYKAKRHFMRRRERTSPS